jgi:uracil-DNA glycosylase
MSAEPFVPKAARSIAALSSAARECEGCDLFRDATQTVFGAGPRSAKFFLVGEQPGDAEDKAGEPFVGPAGRLLDRALIEAGIDREAVYVTNAVKHFKFVRREGGKRRIHDKPDRTEVLACHPWLAAELALVKPACVVILGATAGQSLLGPKFRVTHERGRVLLTPVGTVVATIHPSAILRARDREAQYENFVDDLRVAAALG